MRQSCNQAAGGLRFPNLAIVLFIGLFGASPAIAERVQGSGSTFAFPIISAWTKSFLEFRSAS